MSWTRLATLGVVVAIISLGFVSGTGCNTSRKHTVELIPLQKDARERNQALAHADTLTSRQVPRS